MIPIETALSRLGSRFCLNLRPQNRVVAHGAVGRFLDEIADLVIGLEAGGQRRVLPLCREGEVFEFVSMELTMTSVTFRCECRPLGVALDVTLRAPFYPRDVEISTAPVFYVDLTAWSLPPLVHHPPRSADQVTLILGLKRPRTRITEGPGRLELSYMTQIETQRISDDPDKPPAGGKWLITSIACRERIEACEGDARVEGGALRWRVNLSDGPRTVSALWVAHVSDPVFQRGGKTHRFTYAARHDSLDAVAAWARENREDILEKCRLFDGTVSGSSLSKSQQAYIAFAFQSYLMNTWWVEDAEGRDWFSVWEGCCRFHSTVDVEYNLSMVYFALWPELLEKTFAEWEEYEKPGAPDRKGRPTGWLSHDMGSCQHADGQDYGHEMEVEENCNFILLLHALWRWTARREMLTRHAPLLERLMRFLIASDTTGNGFPNVGVANTIDDATPAIQFAREQTYLAVKAICAARAAADIARELGNADLRAECEAFADLATATLDREAWLGDHFAVCIDKSTDGLMHAWTGKQMERSELPGWDAHSIYTTNGMLLPLMSGLETGLNLGRMRADLRAGLQHAMTEYGCTHSSFDRTNGWFSQNLWRDFVACHLGLDLLSESERHWAYQILRNRREDGDCFIDTFGTNRLNCYPRGITSLGLLFAAVGLQIDRVAKTVSLQPVRVPARVPLLPFADWERGEIPWIEYRLAGGRVLVTLEDRGLLDGWVVMTGVTG